MSPSILNQYKQIGYARIHPDGVNDPNQLEGYSLDHLFTDTASSSDSERPQWELCLSVLAEGDMLFVQNMSILGRNLSDLQKIIQKVVDRGVAIYFCDEDQQVDEESTHFLSALDQLAKFDQAVIAERRKQGMLHARKQGKIFGRTPVADETKQQVVALVKEGVHKQQVANQCGIAISSVYNIIREAKC